MWNHFGHDIADATPEQLSFYNWWLRELEQGGVPDIGGNCAYVEMLIHGKVEEFERTGDAGTFCKQLQALARAYGGCSEADELGAWIGRRLHALAMAQGGCLSQRRHRTYLINLVRQAFIFIGDYDGAWEAGRSLPLQLEDVLYLRPKCASQSIDGMDMVRIPLSEVQGLTGYGEDHIGEIVEIATRLLSTFEADHNCSYIEHLSGALDCQNLSSDDLEHLRSMYQDEDEFLHNRAFYRYEIQHYDSFPNYQPCTLGLRGSYVIQGPYIPVVIKRAVEHALGSFLRKCENALREELGLPRIGGGWLAETELFRRLCEAFPEESIVHHGRPLWLPGQHLDVYFPKRNVACEYQGVQHNEPVDRFGGTEGFIEVKKRDAKKKRLCKKHGCQLIYVHEGYDLSEVILHIQEALG